jgi:cell division septation protein DedD
MNRSRRFELWISGILVVVCLLLLNILVGQFQKKPTLRLVGVDRARSVSIAEHPPASSHENHEPRRVEAVPNSTAAAKIRLHPLDRVAPHPFASEQAKRLVSMPPAEAHLHAVAPPQPKTITLEPLGYVEKADGRVEAIISLEDRVHVVHEGETFEDNFRVAKVSSSAVELVENSAPVAQARLTAEVAQGVSQAPADKAGQTISRPVPEQVSNTGANRQFDAASAASGSQPSVRRELGYVERADGRVEAIVADGEHVRLSQATRAFANEFHGPTASPANVELANGSPPAINPPDSLVLESQPVQTNSFTQQADGPPLVALQSESPTVDEPQGIRGNYGGSESEQFGIIQPEPLADYSGGRFEVKIPQAVMPTSPAVGHTLPSDGRGTQSAVKTLGYVEKAGGEEEVIVEVFGQVHLVHEGESFAEKSRALQVTASPLAAQAMHMPSTTAQVRPEISGFGAGGAIQGIFAVQVGAFRDRSNAERLKECIKSQFGPVIIQDFERDDGLFYRVRVGHEGTEDAARSLAQSLRRANLATGTFVVRLN